jgi:hypothetical protein
MSNGGLVATGVIVFLIIMAGCWFYDIEPDVGKAVRNSAIGAIIVMFIVFAVRDISGWLAKRKKK